MRVCLRVHQSEARIVDAGDERERERERERESHGLCDRKENLFKLGTTCDKRVSVYELRIGAKILLVNMYLSWK